MDKKIKKIIDRLKPLLQADGGNLEFVSFDKKTGTLKVELTGACAFCPLSAVTLKQVIEKKIKDEIPDVQLVVAV